MMIKYTEKLETNIKSELHEGTKHAKWIHKTKQKNVLQKYFTKNSRGYDSNLHLWQLISKTSILWKVPQNQDLSE